MNRLLLLCIFFTSCATKHYLVKLTEKVDPDIVLINIEEGDRAFVGQLILKIDSCKPILIGIDSWFVFEKDSYQDSVLVNALRLVTNDILGYSLDSTGHVLRSHEKFRAHVSGEGLSVIEQMEDYSIYITPVSSIDSADHELFPLKIIKSWKPDFVSKAGKGVSIPIKFRRTLDQFVHFNGSTVTSKNNFKDLNNKVVLLGYLGPSNEDKHFTPIRRIKNYKDNEPDTYGLVVIANGIRTILEYKD